MFGERLRQVRLARGLSLEALAEAMGGLVTKQALSRYEMGAMRPSPPVLTRMAAALGVKVAYFASAPAVSVEFVAYRKGSGLRQGEQAHVEALVREQLEARVRLQDALGLTDEPALPVTAVKVTSLADAEAAADELRRMWELGRDPIGNLTNVLEHHFVHVLEIDAPGKFDGISAVAYDEARHPRAAAVVSRRGVPGGRQRLNLAHELGHLVLDLADPATGAPAQERAAFRFAGAFLAPADELRREVGDRRFSLSTDELLLLKWRFGMSIQALLHRLHDLDIINASYYRSWTIEVNQQGWRKTEPMELPPEKPSWLRQNILRAVAEGVISVEEAETLLPEPFAVELPAPGGAVVPRPSERTAVLKRRDLMLLPLPERRRLLAEQAARLEEMYRLPASAAGEQPEWKELEAGDLVDY